MPSFTFPLKCSELARNTLDGMFHDAKMVTDPYGCPDCFLWEKLALAILFPPVWPVAPSGRSGGHSSGFDYSEMFCPSVSPTSWSSYSIEDVQDYRQTINLSSLVLLLTLGKMIHFFDRGLLKAFVLDTKVSVI